MGSSNSTPNNYALQGASHPVGADIQVSPQVIKRLEDAKRKVIQGPSPSPPPTQQLTPKSSNSATTVEALIPSALQMKTSEFEQKQFLKTLTKLQELFGNPILWAEHCAAELKEARKELIQCYSEYPNEPLRCHHLAEQYQNLIFSQQYGTILRVKNIFD